jgi:hypothetical protein
VNVTNLELGANRIRVNWGKKIVRCDSHLGYTLGH